MENSPRRKIQKIWNKLLREKAAGLLTIDQSWLNFEVFLSWYLTSKSYLNPDVDYVIDASIADWYNDPSTTVQHYSPQTCILIPRQIYDNIKTCYSRIQLMNGNVIGVNSKTPGRFTTLVTIINPDNTTRRTALGIFDTPDEAFYLYKAFKEDQIQELANKYYQIGALSDIAYNALMNLQIISLVISNDNYNRDYYKSLVNEALNKPSCPFIINDWSLFYPGTIYDIGKYGKGLITEYRSSRDVDVMFLNTGYVKEHVTLDNVVNGSVKDPYHETKYGGVFGEGNFKAIDNMRIYKVWEGMLKRVAGFDHECYYSCSVCPEWYNFQIFAEWYYNEYSKCRSDLYTYHLDKDIFQWNIANKVYSPSTCCLIPISLNCGLAGGYYDNKNHIMSSPDKLLALCNQYLSEGAINANVYNAVMNILNNLN